MPLFPPPATGGGGYVHPNHTGEVASVADGATTIAAGVVTNAKFQNVLTQTIKGRNTAGTGAVEDLTAANARNIVHPYSSNLSNMLFNGGFDDGTLGWTEAGTVAQIVDNAGVAGSQYISLTPASNVIHNAFLFVEEGQLLEFVAMFKGNAAGSNNFRMTYYFYDEANANPLTVNTQFSSTTAWQKGTVLVVVPPGKRKMRCRVEHVTGSAASLMYVDHVSIRRELSNGRMLALANPNVSHTGNLTETTLATINIPAILGANGILRIMPLWTANNSAGNKTLRIRFSGAAGTIFFERPLTTQLVEQDYVMIRNQTAGTQIGHSPISIGIGNGNTGDLVTGAVDTTVATTVVITGQLALGTDSITLKSYTVELLLPN